MKNYYEILEVDIHASSEIIDKAFKVLAKKYHPDTQSEDKKQWAEEQFKMLNEAYEVLSDKEKREAYTKELEFDKNSELQALLLKNADLEVQVEELQSQLETLRNSSNTEQPLNNFYDAYKTYQQIRSEPEIHSTSQDYEPYDIPNINNISYKDIRKKFNATFFREKFKTLFSLFATFCVLVLIGFILWKIPYTHNILIDLYENNSIINSIISLFYK